MGRAGMCPSPAPSFSLLGFWLALGGGGWGHSLNNSTVPLTDAHRMPPAPALQVPLPARESLPLPVGAWPGRPRRGWDLGSRAHWVGVPVSSGHCPVPGH